MNFTEFSKSFEVNLPEFCQQTKSAKNPVCGLLKFCQQSRNDLFLRTCLPHRTISWRLCGIYLPASAGVDMLAVSH